MTTWIIDSRVQPNKGYNDLVKTNPSSAKVNRELQSRRIIALSVLVIVVLAALTGCTNEPRAAAEINPAGDYTLVSVDGKTLPCSLAHDGASLTIKSGAFTIGTNGTCRSLITFSVPGRGDMNREVKATYTRAGAELTMQWEGAGRTLGKVDGNKFTMTNEGMILAYQK